MAPNWPSRYCGKGCLHPVSLPIAYPEAYVKAALSETLADTLTWADRHATHPIEIVIDPSLLGFVIAIAN